MDDDTVSDEHPPSKAEGAFNRFVARQPDHRAPFPVSNPQQGDMARRLTQHGPALPWYANAFQCRT